MFILKNRTVDFWTGLNEYIIYGSDGKKIRSFVTKPKTAIRYASIFRLQAISPAALSSFAIS